MQFIPEIHLFSFVLSLTLTISGNDIATLSHMSCVYIMSVFQNYVMTKTPKGFFLMFHTNRTQSLNGPQIESATDSVDGFKSSSMVLKSSLYPPQQCYKNSSLWLFMDAGKCLTCGNHNFWCCWDSSSSICFWIQIRMSAQVLDTSCSPPMNRFSPDSSC